ncbi:MAG: hypothetical protein IKY94_06885 [Lachnospiraceae bacterium]|nr:hypothetical protein [Lachnospiraceae bacterium]
MAILIDEINLLEIFKDLGKICKSPNVCGTCADKSCLIGYARSGAAECRIAKRTGIMNGFENIPPCDIRGGYDEYEVLHAIAHLLVQCKGCKEDHYDNCLINIVRSCLEVIEFGEEQKYEGNVIQYLMKISQSNPTKAAIIQEEYMLHKDSE